MTISTKTPKRSKPISNIMSSVSTIISKNNLKNQQDLPSIKDIDEAVKDIAAILTNIVVVGKEKRRACRYFDPVRGVCNRLKLDGHIPTLTLVPDGSDFKILVASHPEICAVCPFCIITT